MTTLRRNELTPEEYPNFYHTYVSCVPAELTLDDALTNSYRRLTDYFADLPPTKHDYAYALGKWTVAQALQHIVDTERVFAYRALRIGRGDTTPLPGFDQELFASSAPQCPAVGDLLTEFEWLRQSTRALFASFDAEALGRTGTASGGSVSTRALGFILSGHIYHHVRIYRGLYV